MKEKIKNKKPHSKSISVWIIFAILCLYALSMFILFSWGIITSLKERGDFYDNVIGLPRGNIWEWAWGNYTKVLQNFNVYTTNLKGQRIVTNFLGLLTNTLLYAVGGAIVQTIVPCMCAYAGQKYAFKFSKIIYAVNLITMVIPIFGTTPATILLLKNIGLYDNVFSIYILKFHFLGMHFMIFWAAFQSLSKEYYEAASIDGASEFQIMTKIMLPLLKATIYTIFLIKFIGFWNDYQTALLFMPSKPTISYGVYLMTISGEEGFSTTPMKITSCMILALPMAVLFVSFRDKIMGNLTMGGVKE